MAKKSKKKNTGTTETPTNGWDALIRFMDIIYDLFSTGNIIGAALFVFFFWVMLVTYRLPNTALNENLKFVLNVFSRDQFYLFPLTTLSMFSISINIFQRKVYQKDIKRLKDVRKNLMHGRESGALIPLENHTSCDLTIEDV
nr:hypothetical protein [uncultured Desulfuromonas sp.]